ncbi:MAG: HupE/UreJ family protein [Saprospiraceae bacterium]|nr:HupE/UreJ family protein [Saprospiraceae bacterium]
MFTEYLKLGMDHILDPNGYDHILFVTVLCSLYSPEEWKKLVILVTAFTLGHSLTLGLAAFEVVSFSSDVVEILIPVTIILTGLYNIIMTLTPKYVIGNFHINYLLAAGFGLIHGLGFSTFFKAIMGRTEEIIRPLFAFNIGVEAGQLIIVALILMIGYILLNIIKLKKPYWTLSISLLSIIVASHLLLQKI